MSRNGTPAAKWTTLRKRAKTVFLPSYNTVSLNFEIFFGADWWPTKGSGVWGEEGMMSEQATMEVLRRENQQLNTALEMSVRLIRKWHGMKLVAGESALLAEVLPRRARDGPDSRGAGPPRFCARFVPAVNGRGVVSRLECGRPVGTRTRDLYRVKVAL